MAVRNEAEYRRLHIEMWEGVIQWLYNGYDMRLTSLTTLKEWNIPGDFASPWNNCYACQAAKEHKDKDKASNKEVFVEICNYCPLEAIPCNNRSSNWNKLTEAWNITGIRADAIAAAVKIRDSWL